MVNEVGWDPTVVCGDNKNGSAGMGKNEHGRY
jgi:hypothetical protein